MASAARAVSSAGRQLTGDGEQQCRPARVDQFGPRPPGPAGRRQRPTEPRPATANSPSASSIRPSAVPATARTSASSPVRGSSSVGATAPGGLVPVGIPGRSTPAGVSARPAPAGVPGRPAPAGTPGRPGPVAVAVASSRAAARRTSGWSPASRARVSSSASGQPTEPVPARGRQRAGRRHRVPQPGGRRLRGRPRTPARHRRPTPAPGPGAPPRRAAAQVGVRPVAPGRTAPAPASGSAAARWPGPTARR